MVKLMEINDCIREIIFAYQADIPIIQGLRLR